MPSLFHATADTQLQLVNLRSMGLQSLVAELRTELADARQETRIATEALTASTELTGRLQAHAEIAREQGAAAVQRVTHEHRRAAADLEHRLQQATAALQRTTAAAASADVQQRETIQALQQHLEAALAQTHAAASSNAELAGAAAQLQAQLDSATSNMTRQTAASEEAVAHMRAQVDALHHQLTTVTQAAADKEAGLGTAAAGGQSALHQAALQQAEEVCELQQKLENTEGMLQSMTAADAAADRRQVVQALQQHLAEAGEQVLVAQGQVFDSAGAIAELQQQLAAAQDALHRKAEITTNTVQYLQSQVDRQASMIAQCWPYLCHASLQSCSASLQCIPEIKDMLQEMLNMVYCVMVLPSQSM